MITCYSLDYFENKIYVCGWCDSVLAASSLLNSLMTVEHLEKGYEGSSSDGYFDFFQKRGAPTIYNVLLVRA